MSLPTSPLHFFLPTSPFQLLPSNSPISLLRCHHTSTQPSRDGDDLRKPFRTSARVRPDSSANTTANSTFRESSEATRLRHMGCTAARAMQTRRQFCVHACHAASVAAVGSILNGCGDSNPAGPSGGSTPQLATATSTVASNQVSLTIDAASPLASVGSAAIVQNSLGSFLVA